MSQRIRQLEDALAIAATKHTVSGIHPLLSDDLLTIKFGPESRMNAEPSTDSQEEDTETDHSLSTPGSFFRCPDGSTKYFGPSGGSGRHHILSYLDPFLTSKRRNRIAGRLMYPRYFKVTETLPRLGMNLLPIVRMAEDMERAGASPSSRMATIIETGCPC